MGISHKEEDKREDRREEGATAGVAPQEAKRKEKEKSLKIEQTHENRGRGAWEREPYHD